MLLQHPTEHNPLSHATPTNTDFSQSASKSKRLLRRMSAVAPFKSNEELLLTPPIKVQADPDVVDTEHADFRLNEAMNKLICRVQELESRVELWESPLHQMTLNTGSTPMVRGVTAAQQIPSWASTFNNRLAVLEQKLGNHCEMPSLEFETTPNAPSGLTVLEYQGQNGASCQNVKSSGVPASVSRKFSSNGVTPNGSLSRALGSFLDVVHRCSSVNDVANEIISTTNDKVQVSPRTSHFDGGDASVSVSSHSAGRKTKAANPKGSADDILSHRVSSKAFTFNHTPTSRSQTSMPPDSVYSSGVKSPVNDTWKDMFTPSVNMSSPEGTSSICSPRQQLNRNRVTGESNVKV